MVRRIERWVNRPTPEELERIKSEIRNTEIDLARRSRGDTAPWVTSATSELSEAKPAIDKPDASRAELESAWSALKAAKRSIAHSFDATELADAAIATRTEATDKLHSWRLTTVNELLGQDAIGDGQLHDRVSRIERVLVLKPDSEDTLAERVQRAEAELKCRPDQSRQANGQPEADTQNCTSNSLGIRVDDLERRLGIGLRDGVILSREILDEHADNVYRKLALLRVSVWRTSGILLVALLALGLVVARGWATLATGDADADANLILESWRLLLVVLVLGSLGALVSAATNLGDQDRKRRIPDQLVGMSLMGMRPLVGAASAAIVVIILQTGLSEELTVTGPAIFAVALAAGFTERLVTNVVASAAANAKK